MGKRPGVEINVITEGLVIVRPFSMGTIGLIGTASKGSNAYSVSGSAYMNEEPLLCGSYQEIETAFGTYDSITTVSELSLSRAAEIAFRHGATSIYALRVTDGVESGATYVLEDPFGTAGLEISGSEFGSYGHDVGIKIDDYDDNEIKYAIQTDIWTVNNGPYAHPLEKINGTRTGFSLTHPVWTGAAFIDGNTIAQASTTGTEYLKIEYKSDAQGEGDWTAFDGVDVRAVEDMEIVLADGGIGHDEMSSWDGAGAGWIASEGGVFLSSHAGVLIGTGENNVVFPSPPAQKYWGGSDDLMLRAKYIVKKKKCTVTYNDQVENFPFSHSGDLRSQLSGSIFVRGIETDHGNSGVLTMPANMATVNLASGGDGNLDLSASDYVSALAIFENYDCDIMLVPGTGNTMVWNKVKQHCVNMSDIKKERVGVVGHDTGSEFGTLMGLTAETSSKDLIVATPGIEYSNRYSGMQETGNYMSAAVAGTIARYPVHVSLLNKTLQIDGVETVYTVAQQEKLLDANYLVIYKEYGYRVLDAITTSTSSVWHDITTVRIVNYAKKGVRDASREFIGKKNNVRVRTTLKSAISRFLRSMVNDEALEGYEIDIIATRDDVITGDVRVSLVIKPVFAIKYIKINMNLA